ncbi:MAG: chromosomal replication initiator protein DnaA [Victivallaceae bacterium]|nr:chromosomal replication initiator protein DnaA [Victivallaceae bacterium]
MSSQGVAPMCEADLFQSREELLTEVPASSDGEACNVPSGRTDVAAAVSGTLTPAEVWDAACRILRAGKNLSGETFKQWFINTVAVGFDEHGDLIVGVPDEFFGNWFTSSYGDRVAAALKAVGDGYGFVMRTGVTPPPRPEPVEPAAVPAVSAASAVPAAQRQFQSVVASGVASSSGHSPVHPQFARRHTFENFVVGEENRYAFTSARAVATTPGIYNPLYIYGDTGTGKTHLMQAVRCQLMENNPNIKVRYASCEEVLNDFVNSLAPRSSSQNSFADFRSSLREVDVLLIDDIHTMAHKKALQEQFFNAFNELYRANKQIVLTCDKQPCDIDGLEKRLVSRFEAGVITELLPPGYEIRLAILRQTAAECGSPVQDDVLDFLAANISSNVRRLKGAMLRVVGAASASGVPVTVNFAGELLHAMLEDECSAKSVSMETIISKVAEHFDLRINDILSNRRPRNIAEPRMMAMYLCRKLTNCSYPEIGSAFGKNHATVLNAMERVPRLCGESEKLRRSLAQLERQLKHN